MSKGAKRFTAEVVITDHKTEKERHFFIAGDTAKDVRHGLYRWSFLDLWGEEVRALKEWMHENHIKSVKDRPQKK